MFKADVRQLNKVVVELANVHKAALPNAVRFTLNDLAFDVKKNSLAQAVKDTMIVRNPAFFKRYSGVEKATGWEIGKMQATAGMIPSGDASKTVERLKQQDEGGTLRHDAIALNPARRGKTVQGKIKAGAYRKKMHFWGEKIQYGNTQGLIKAVTKSGITSGGTNKGNVVIYGKYVYEIIGYKHLGTGKKHTKIKLYLNRLYEYVPNQTVHLKPRNFTKLAGNQSGSKVQEIFAANAEKQLAKWR